MKQNVLKSIFKNSFTTFNVNVRFFGKVIVEKFYADCHGCEIELDLFTTDCEVFSNDTCANTVCLRVRCYKLTL